MTLGPAVTWSGLAVMLSGVFILVVFDDDRGLLPFFLGVLMMFMGDLIG